MSIEYLNTWKEDETVLILPIIGIHFGPLRKVIFGWAIWGVVIEW